VFVGKEDEDVRDWAMLLLVDRKRGTSLFLYDFREVSESADVIDDLFTQVSDATPIYDAAAVLETVDVVYNFFGEILVGANTLHVVEKEADEDE
jgi:hypothetical protein